jgi:hypothetical protein
MSKLFAYLSYRDVDAVITWLEALGFETTTRQQDDGGATVHAELRLGDAVVMVAPADEPYETPKLIGRSTGQPWFARLGCAAMEASGTHIESGRVISEAFENYRNYAGPLLAVALLVVGIAGVISGVLGASDSLLLALLGLIVYIAAAVLYTGYVVKLVQDVRDGRRDHSVAELFESAAPYIGTLILNGILAAIGIGIGLVLLIVPGLILITIWAVVAPAIVVEGAGVIGAFVRSRDLVRGNGWPVFGAIVIAYLIVLGVSFVTAGVGDAIADDAGHVILGTIGDILAAPVLALVASALFFDLGGGAGAPAD